jgi:energy-coupling factor transporter transmembrane protein EcfT
MTSTHVLSPSTASAVTPSVADAPSTSPFIVARRLPAAALGLLGAGLLGYGVTQPWISSFAGLISQSGWGSRNGSILFAAAVVSGVLALAQVVFASTMVRWLLALVGFAAAGFAGYLLIQLYTVTESSDSMVFLGKGPGLYISAGGAALVFATIFLPMPTSSRSRVTDSSDGERGTLLSGLMSPLRVPGAALALVAGLAHVPVTPEHLNEAPYIGGLFIALTIACVLLAAALLVWDSPLVWAAAGATCLLAVIAYVVSRSVGLPLMGDDVGNWLETLGVVSVLSETGVVLVSAFALRRVWRRQTVRPSSA